MKFFQRKQKHAINTRRPQPSQNKKLKPVLKLFASGMVISMGLWAMGYAAMHFNQKLSVTHWSVEADSELQIKIEQFLEAQTVLDFWNTRAAVMQSTLLTQIPDIKTLEVIRILPYGLRIKATSRSAVALWESKSGVPQVMLVDADAVAYRPLNRGENVDLPLLRLNQHELAQAMALLHTLRQQDANKLAHLSELIVIDQQWRLNFSYGEQWLFQQEKIEQDLKQVVAILGQPRWLNNYWRMDARMPQRWFIRPAKQEVI